MKKILITGPESSGKSFLAMELSDFFKGGWVKEFAREYLDGKTSYNESDLLRIASGQKHREEIEWAKRIPFVFSDTGIEVISIWSTVKYGRVNPEIMELLNLKNYDLILLCKPNIPWQEDPLREHPKQRDELFDAYLEFLQSHKVDFQIIDESLEYRVKQAINCIELIR